MSDPTSYGLIVEGPYDKPFYERLIKRICSDDPEVKIRVCDGVPNLMKLFPGLLRDFEHVMNGRPVDKAMVIRDSQGPDSETPRKKMAEKIQGRKFAFPRGVHVFVVRREMETWLLADARAINAVSLARGGREVGEVREAPEDIHDPKRQLQSLLSLARIEYTAAVCGEIAVNLNIERLENRCPSFRIFKQTVLDC